MQLAAHAPGAGAREVEARAARLAGKNAARTSAAAAAAAAAEAQPHSPAAVTAPSAAQAVERHAQASGGGVPEEAMEGTAGTCTSVDSRIFPR